MTNAKLNVGHIIGHLLICDGLLTDEESAFMHQLLGERLKLSPEERQEVIDGINIDLDLDAKLETLDAEALSELVAIMEEAAAIDGDVAGSEQDLINRVKAFIAQAASAPED
ncbi:MAG: TerB family tellurite resistance protein [Myxococcota bacterium]